MKSGWWDVSAVLDLLGEAQQLKRVELEKEILKKATALLMSDSLNNLR